MTIEERSNHIKNLDFEIDMLIEKKKYLYAKVTKITLAYKTINVQESSVYGSKIDSYMSEMGELLDKINSKLIEQDKLRLELEHDIKRVPDERMRLLLESRYLYFRPWEYVASLVKYSVPHVKKYYLKKCLSEFAKVNTLNPK